ncbi:M48 family metallopeptidase [Streptomyces sp. LN785]|uniref:M48 family metallopeptidase n=1 Tax=Streptomyces sp. LN785 TaxID=3112983 RepID=UPI00371705E7
MFAFLLAGRLGPVRHAVVVEPDDEPELWERLRVAVDAAGERPPDELYLVADVNAGVAEQSRLLGLLPGRRRMLLGLPLLAGLTVPRLRAVLANEFGHYSNLDTRLGGVVMRGRRAVLHTVGMFREGSTQLHQVIGAMYVRYAHMFLRASQSVARDQEFAADRLAAVPAERESRPRDPRVIDRRSMPVDPLTPARTGQPAASGTTACSPLQLAHPQHTTRQPDHVGPGRLPTLSSAAFPIAGRPRLFDVCGLYPVTPDPEQ